MIVLDKKAEPRGINMKETEQSQIRPDVSLLPANAEVSCMEQLKAIYPDIRNPYAQSKACLLFGMRKQTDTLPLLLREYERMKKSYPDESFAEGPLLGIYLLFDKA